MPPRLYQVRRHQGRMTLRPEMTCRVISDARRIHALYGSRRRLHLGEKECCLCGSVCKIPAELARTDKPCYTEGADILIMGLTVGTYAVRYKTQVKPITDPDALAFALSLLRAGHVIAVPTDTVYGVAADGLNPDAIERLYEVKQRPRERPIPLLLADLEDVWHVIRSFPAPAHRLARTFWPGPLTLVLPARPEIPSVLLAGGTTVGVRIPAHERLRELIRRFGRPLAATSANLSDHPPALTAEDVLAQLSGRIPLILDDGPAPGGQPSTVVDCTGSEPVILRPGPLSEEAIARVWFGEQGTGTSS